MSIKRTIDLVLADRLTKLVDDYEHAADIRDAEGDRLAETDRCAERHIWHARANESRRCAARLREFIAASTQPEDAK